MNPCAFKEKVQGLYFQWERMEDFKIRKEGVREMTGRSQRDDWCNGTNQK